MKENKVVIVAGDMVTSYGWGIDVCWKGLLAGQCTLRRIEHFDMAAHRGEAGIIADLAVETDGSRAIAMLRPLLTQASSMIPGDAFCLLATTLGEIEYLEKTVLEGSGNLEKSCPSRLLLKVESILKTKKPGLVVSAACSSAGVAISEAANMIKDGEQDAVVVVACDSVSEFLVAGFSSLFALDSHKARPFDLHRGGLSVGEAAGYVLLMSDKRAVLENRKILGEIAGWGISNDANHMTGPSRDGLGLADAITQSLDSARVNPKDVCNISAHGTGTIYNDAMEIKAFKAVFGAAVPTYSIKGAIGHSMAAAGLIELLVTLKSLEDLIIPPTIGLSQVDPEASGWISGEAQTVYGRYALSTSSGFGGVNVALLLQGGRA